MSTKLNPHIQFAVVTEQRVGPVGIEYPSAGGDVSSCRLTTEGIVFCCNESVHGTDKFFPFIIAAPGVAIQCLYQLHFVHEGLAFISMGRRQLTFKSLTSVWPRSFRCN